MRATVSLPCLLVLASVLPACGTEPKLDVRQQGASAPATRNEESAQVAPAPAGAPIEAAPAHVPAAGELPPGHPAVGDLPPGHPATGGAMPAGGAMMPSVDPNTGQGASAIAWTTPAGWIAEPPANSMRRAQYRVPGAAGDGECVVFYFGPGQGGSPMANAERWASQFTNAQGQPATDTMKTSTEVVNGAQLLHVEARGTYLSGGMMGDPVVPKPGSALLGAVVAGPDANWFFKFTGPEATVEAQRTAFQELLRSVRHGG
jgi:hypothetical protein